jgi:drug/metabolite transporter (DMT)-like permease
MTERVTPAVTTWAIFALAFPALLLYLLARGIPAVQPTFWLALGANVALYLVSFRLYVSALEKGDLGVTYPLLALTPVLVVPVEWVLLGERAGVQGITGIVLVVVGVYLLNFRGGDRPLLEPFRALARDPGARRMMAVTVLWAVSGTVDRVAVLNASPAFYGVALSMGMGLGFLPAALESGRTEKEADTDGGSDGRGEACDGTTDAGAPGGPAAAAEAHGARGPAGADDAADGAGGPAGAIEGDGPEHRAGLRRSLAEHPWLLAGQGMLFAAMFLCQMEALRLSLAAYVLAIKRSGTLLAILLGGAVFREGATGRRLAATTVILAGVVLVGTS